MSKEYSKGGVIAATILLLGAAYGLLLPLFNKNASYEYFFNIVILLIPALVLMRRSYILPLGYKKGVATYFGAVLLSSPLAIFESNAKADATNVVAFVIYVFVGYRLLRYSFKRAVIL